MSTVEAEPVTKQTPLPAPGVLLSTGEVAAICKTTRDNVLNWITSRALVAVNIAADLTTRPRYRVESGDLAAFLADRKTQPRELPNTKAARRRRGVEKAVAESLPFFDAAGRATGVR